MKSITILTAVALLAVALVGCGTKEEPTAPTTPAPEETTSWFDRFRGEPEAEVVEAPVEESWRWFGWFRTDDEPEEVIVEETEEKGWFTKR
jgi:hypothetical protein